MNISFNGIGDRLVTFYSDEVMAGHVVYVSDCGMVSECEEGDPFDGVAMFVDDGLAAVRLGGFVTLSYSGTTPDIGRVTLVADGEGGVEVDEDGETYLVVDEDTTNGTVTLIL